MAHLTPESVENILNTTTVEDTNPHHRMGDKLPLRGEDHQPTAPGTLRYEAGDARIVGALIAQHNAGVSLISGLRAYLDRLERRYQDSQQQVLDKERELSSAKERHVAQCRELRNTIRDVCSHPGTFKPLNAEVPQCTACGVNIMVPYRKGDLNYLGAARKFPPFGIDVNRVDLELLAAELALYLGGTFEKPNPNTSAHLIASGLVDRIHKLPPHDHDEVLILAYEIAGLGVDPPMRSLGEWQITSRNGDEVGVEFVLYQPPQMHCAPTGFSIGGLVEDFERQERDFIRRDPISGVPPERK